MVSKIALSDVDPPPLFEGPPLGAYEVWGAAGSSPVDLYLVSDKYSRHSRYTLGTLRALVLIEGFEET